MVKFKAEDKGLEKGKDKSMGKITARNIKAQ